MMDLKYLEILKAPVVTEKSEADKNNGVYTFKVDPKANKIEITENEFKFIKYILSNNKFIVVQSISDFLRAISILNFNDLQKQEIADLIFQNLNILSKNCDFELNVLITKLIEPNKFFMQVEIIKNNLDDYSRKYLLDFIFYEKEYLENGFNEDEINDFIEFLSYPR